MAHDTCAVVRPGQFKVNLTSLLDCLNVFSHSLVRDNPLEIEYSRGEAMQLRCAPCCRAGHRSAALRLCSLPLRARRRLTEADHEACCTVQTVEEGACPCLVAESHRASAASTDSRLWPAADDAEDLHMGAVTNKVIIEVGFLPPATPVLSVVTPALTRWSAAPVRGPARRAGRDRLVQPLRDCVARSAVARDHGGLHQRLLLRGERARARAWACGTDV